MYSAIVIDDEQNARSALHLLVNRYLADRLKIVETAASVKEGVFQVYKHHPDLVFLDIEMPDENGFRFFEYFKRIDFEVIFTTAYKDYAIDAIKVAAQDYLLKPIDYRELKEAFNRFEKRRAEGSIGKHLENLLTRTSQGHDPYGKVALPTFDGYRMEKISQILYCQANENYCQIHCISGEVFLVSKPLHDIEELLPKDLIFRIHKSFLVNLNYIKTYSRTDGFHIILENGETLQVAQRRNEEFLHALTGKNKHQPSPDG